MSTIEFTEDKLAASPAFLRDVIAADGFTLAPRLYSLADGSMTSLSRRLTVDLRIEPAGAVDARL